MFLEKIKNHDEMLKKKLLSLSIIYRLENLLTAKQKNKGNVLKARVNCSFRLKAHVKKPGSNPSQTFYMLKVHLNCRVDICALAFLTLCPVVSTVSLIGSLQAFCGQ